MRKKSSTTFLVPVLVTFLLALHLSTFAQQMQENQKATIAVISYDDFVPDRSGVNDTRRIGLPDMLAARIIENLSKSQRFDVVERKALRRVVTGQRFGKKMKKNYLDKTLDKAITDMDKMWGTEVDATAYWSNHNDLIKDFQDLGSTVGADFLVLGSLEKVAVKLKATAVPYSNKVHRKKTMDARLQLRVIDVRTGIIKGAASIRTRVSENLFAGKEDDADDYQFFDTLAMDASRKILDLTFPAKIVSLDPLIISRGSHDGVKPGDIFVIKREAKVIKDSNGVVLGHLKKEIGKVQVAQVQENIAIVKPMKAELSDAGSFSEGDLAEQIIMGKNAKKQQQTAQVPTGADATGKPVLAVGLVKYGSTANTSEKAKLHSPIFTDNLISRLSQTRRFELIDRQEVDQLLNEQLAQALAEQKDLASAMGSLKGADYLIYGNLASISEKTVKTRLPGSSRVLEQRKGQASGNMRIVDVKSGTVIASRSIRVEALLPLRASESEIIATLADSYSERVVLMLMEALYPIKIAHVSSSGQVYINRGSDGGLQVGEMLKVYAMGADIIDPDTGVKLGKEETYLGKVVVTEVEAARSKGDIIEGSEIKRGHLLKRTVSHSDKNVAGGKGVLPRSGGKIGDRAVAGKVKKPVLAMGSIRLDRSARTSSGFNSGYLKRIADNMINQLMASRRFVVMERSEVDQVLDEKTFEAITRGGDIKHRLGALQAADYILHGEINNFYISTQKRKVAYLDEIQITARAHAEGVFRIVDVHKGEIVSAEKVKINQKVKKTGDETELMSQLVDKFVTRAVAKIILRLYPVKVMGVAADGTIYLNRGSDAGIVVGSLYRVMRAGEALIDPDTGESFGSTETEVARVRIIEVEDRRSRAEVESGDDPVRGDILRPLGSSKAKRKQRVMQPNW